MAQGDSELSGDQKFILHLVDRVAGVVLFAIKAAVILGVTFGVVYALRLIFQHAINANIKVDAKANLAIHIFSLLGERSEWAWGVAVFSIIYGLGERELRRRKTEYLQGRIKKLEHTIDAHRSTSGLNPRGETRLEDQ